MTETELVAIRKKLEVASVALAETNGGAPDAYLREMRALLDHIDYLDAWAKEAQELFYEASEGSGSSDPEALKRFMDQVTDRVKERTATPQSEPRPYINIITVNVSGHPTRIEVGVHSQLSAIIPQALWKSMKSTSPPENWELRDDTGRLLDRNHPVGAYRFPGNTTLYLNRKAGIGG